MAGCYLQLIFLIPLCVVNYFINNNILNIIILGINFMIIFTVNPFLKFDGYWALVDILGIENLQKKSLLFIKKIIQYWVMNNKNEFPFICGNNKIQKSIFIAYSFIMAIFVTILIPFMIYHTPIRIQKILVSITNIVSNYHDVSTIIIELIHIAISTIFLFAVFKIIKGSLTYLWRKFSEKRNYEHV
jgi:putative peptide zinc metalloprotease protein